MYHFRLMDLGHSRLIPLLGGADVMSKSLDPALMAPEVYEGNPAGAQSSLYMLGQMIYWVCAGGHPLAGLSLATANAKHKAGEMPHLRGYRADIPDSLVRWIYYLIQPDVKARLRNFREARFLLPSFEEIEGERVTVAAPRKMTFEDI